MKKILCVVLSLLMIMPMVASNVIAGEVGYSQSAQNVYIAGDLSKAGVNSSESVTLTIVEEGTGDVKYIAEIDVNSDLKYETKFKFTDELSNCKIRISEGKNDVIQSVEALYVTQPTTYSLTLRDENGSQVIEADEIIKTTAQITNKYGNGGTFQIIAAFYDANNKMIACEEITDGSFTFYELEKEINALSGIKVPAEAKKIKAFMWNDTQTIIPLSKEQVKLVGDETFGGDTEQITVAFIGDSLTAQTQYLKVLEHYYHTRYPDKDIVFINKGIGGNSYGDVISRFYWDITENEVTGEVDEATLLLGFNDVLLGMAWPNENEQEVKVAFDANIEKYLNRCEQVIEMCRDKGISLTLVSPAVFDHGAYYEYGGWGHRHFPETVNSYGLYKMKEGVAQIAKDNNLPFIDVWTPTTNVTNEVRKNDGNDECTKVITGSDGVHPTEQGGFYMSYEIIKQQDGNPIVAKVEIDAKTGAKATERADVVVTDNKSDRVVYQYLAHAIPVAYTDHYKQFEDWGVPVTEDINQEILKLQTLMKELITLKLENILSAKIIQHQNLQMA